MEYAPTEAVTCKYRQSLRHASVTPPFAQRRQSEITICIEGKRDVEGAVPYGLRLLDRCGPSGRPLPTDWGVA